VVRTSPVAAEPASEPFGYESLAAGLDAHSRAVAANPWTDRTFFPVRDVVPVRTAGGWTMVDRAGESLPVAATDRAGWTLLAVSGGGAVGLAAEFDGKVLTPLAVTTNRTTLPLAGADREAA
jgi:hypothetical protein